MQDLLTLKYPAKADNIQSLRAMGVADDEIESGMRGKIASMLDLGASMKEVNDSLGFGEVQRARLQQAERDAAVESIGHIWNAGHVLEEAKETGVPLSAALNLPEMLKAAREKDVGVLHERPAFEEFVAKNPGFRRLNAGGVRAIGGVAAGFLASEGTLYRGVEWLTHWDKAREWGDQLTDMSSSLTKGILEGSDPNLWDSVMQGLGSTAFFMIPGMIAAKAVKGTAMAGAALGMGEKAVTSMANWLGASVSGSMEGLSEGGDVYRTILDATGDEGAATLAASKTFWLNLPLNIVLDKFTFFDDAPMLKKLFGKILPEAAADLVARAFGRATKEGLQETLQGGISEQATTGKSWSKLDWLKIAAEQGIPGGIAAAMFGAALPGSAVAESQEDAAKRRGAIKTIFETIRDAAVQSGYAEDASTGAASVFSAFYNALSRRYGIDAQALFDKRGVRIEPGGQSVEPATLEQQAWHGSETRFPRFSTYRIGSDKGEGRGWGLYFTGAKAVGQRFRTIMAGDRYTIGFRDINTVRAEAQEAGDTARVDVLDGVSQGKTLDDLQTEYAGDETHLSAVESVRKAGLKGQGQLYEVEVPENGTLLDWDAAIGEQPDSVRKALEPLVLTGEPTPEFRAWLAQEYADVADGFDSMDGEQQMDLALEYAKRTGKRTPLSASMTTGEDLYRALAAQLGSEKAASEYLDRIGVKGVRYDDEGPNFVVFGDRNVAITKTFYQDAAVPAAVALERDVAAWAETVDRVKDKKVGLRDSIRVMTTPLVFNLVGAKILPVHMSAGKIGQILRDHPGMSMDEFKQLPAALAAPIAIFESSNTENAPHRGLVAMLELKDKDGATVISALHLDVSMRGERGEATVNRLASTYGKESGRKPDNRWFAEQVESGRLLYLDKKKSLDWGRWAGHLAPPAEGTPKGSLSEIVKTDSDLVNLKMQNPELYQGESESPRGSVTLGDGESVVRLFQTADKSTLVHELSHVMLEELRALARDAQTDPALREDWNTLAEWLGIAPDGEITTEAHEKFARGFEAYLMDGRAPSTGLKRVFQLFKDWLTGIYRDVDALGVEISPEVREVFDRLLATDEELQEEYGKSVADEGTPELVENMPPTAEEQARSEAMDALIDGDEEVLLSGEWQGTPEGEQQVDAMLGQEEMRQLAKEQVAERKKLFAEIRALGGIAYDTVRQYFGANAAQDLYRSARSLFRTGGMALDRLVQQLQQAGFLAAEDADGLYRMLTEKPLVPDVPAMAPVNASTASFLLDRLGPHEMLRYVKRRISALEKQATALTSRLDELRNAGDMGDESDMIRVDLAGIYDELSYARDQAKALDASTREAAAPAEEIAPLSLAETMDLAKDGAVRWLDETVKGVVDRVTGKTRVGDLMTEDAALKGALKMLQRESKAIYRAGVDAGALEARVRERAVRQRMRERAVQKRELAGLVRDLDGAMKGDIRVTQREEIRKILSGYDLKRRRRETLERRKQFEEYFRDHPEALPEADLSDVYYMGRTTLSDMTIDDLKALHGRIMQLRDEGRSAYAEWDAANRERVDGMRDELLKTVGGRKRVTGDRVNGRLDPNGGTTWTLKAALWSWLPDSIFRFFDGDHTGKGPFSRFFVAAANAAEDAKLRMLHRRHERMERDLQALGFQGIRDPRWYETRGTDTNPQTGETCTWTTDGLMSVYVGWQNPRYREALIWGLGITPERHDRLVAMLSEEEKQAAVLVVKDHAAEKPALDEVFERVYNAHLADEKNYIRLYRDTFEMDKQGLDMNDAEAMNDLTAQVNGAQKFFVGKGFTFERKHIPAEYQAKVPPKLGLLSNWLSAIEEEAHWVGYGGLVRDLHRLIGEGWDPQIASFRESIEARWGREAFDAIKDYVNRISRSRFYAGYTAIDAAARKLRANMAVAYLSFNLMTVIKQPTVLALTVSRAGLAQTMLSIAEFVAHPKQMLDRVWELDPQVKEQAMDRFIEELKRTVAPTALQRFGQAGFKPIAWFDMFARVVGWNAVYRREIADLAKAGVSPEEAHERAREEAQRYTLRVNNAASPKDLPRYMAHNEYLNLMTAFTNQANKTWNLATYDTIFSTKEGDGWDGFATVAGLMLMGFLTNLIGKGRPPESAKETATWVSSEAFGSIPLAGKLIISRLQGLSGGSTPLDTAAEDIARLALKLGKGKPLTDSTIAGLWEAYALVAGAPYTAPKRVYEAIRDKNPLALVGWAKGERKRRNSTGSRAGLY